MRLPLRSCLAMEMTSIRKHCKRKWRHYTCALHKDMKILLGICWSKKESKWMHKISRNARHYFMPALRVIQTLLKCCCKLVLMPIFAMALVKGICWFFFPHPTRLAPRPTSYSIDITSSIEPLYASVLYILSLPFCSGSGPAGVGVFNTSCLFLLNEHVNTLAASIILQWYLLNCYHYLHKSSHRRILSYFCYESLYFICCNPLLYATIVHCSSHINSK